MDKTEIYMLIKEWEIDAGESILDQGFDLKELTYMTWCLGRNYISKEQYNLFIESWSRNELEAIDSNYYVYCSDSPEDVPWAVISSDGWNEEDNKKAFWILSEFISEIKVYQERLLDFIKGEEE